MQNQSLSEQALKNKNRFLSVELLTKSNTSTAGENQPGAGVLEKAMSLLNIVSGAKAAMNNAAATKDAQNQNTIPVKGARTPAEINKANAEYWATHA